MAGQMTLFDLVPEEEKESFQIKLPDVGEYDKEQLLSFEKEVLGVYISGHPLEEYEDRVEKKHFGGDRGFSCWMRRPALSRVKDGEKVVVGGMITGKTIKYTKNR